MSADVKASTGLRCASCGEPAAVYDGKWFWCGECGKREVPRALALRVRGKERLMEEDWAPCPSCGGPWTLGGDWCPACCKSWDERGAEVLP